MELEEVQVVGKEEEKVGIGYEHLIEFFFQDYPVMCFSQEGNIANYMKIDLCNSFYFSR